MISFIMINELLPREGGGGGGLHFRALRVERSRGRVILHDHVTSPRRKLAPSGRGMEGRGHAEPPGVLLL